MARKGRNAGRPFWGCSRYPQCSGTRTVGDADQSPEVEQSEMPSINWTGPLLEDHGRVLFQMGGGRVSLDTYSDSVQEALVHANLSNWCLIDRSTDHRENPRFSSAQRQVIGVVRKLLTRGRRPVVSPLAEDWTLANAGLPFGFERVSGAAGEILFRIGHRRHDRLLRDELLRATSPVPSIGTPRRWRLDSDDEEYFLHKVFGLAVANEAISYLHPQVLLSNLLPQHQSDLANSRVDFLFAPPGSRPLIIEIDGHQHEQTKASDKQRDDILRRAGYEVARLSTREATSGQGPGWDKIRECWDLRVMGSEGAPWGRRLLWTPAMVTRIQLALLYAIEQGILGLGADRWELRVVERDIEAASVAISDFRDLFTHAEELYGTAIWPKAVAFSTLVDGRIESTILGRNEGEPEVVDYLDLDVSACQSYLLEPEAPTEFYPEWGKRPLLDIRVANIHRLVSPPTAPGVTATMVPNVQPNVLRYFLQTVFRKNDFREGQFEAIARTLGRKDSIVLLPTGAGKSLIYQLAGLLSPGVTMIVDPIISLIEDQIYNLRRYGIDRAVGISSLIEDPKERHEALQAFGRGDFLFCYVAPERLQTPQFRQQCRSLNAFTSFNLWVIDEAHCVSEWGHEFRTAYLNLGRVARDLGSKDGFVPPLLALTGTASRAVLRDVQRELLIIDSEAVIRPPTFDRPELNFGIVKASSRDKKTVLIGTLHRIMGEFGVDAATMFTPAGDQTMGGLIFCPHVNGPYGVVEVAKILRETFRAEVNVYAGSAPKGQDRRNWNREKSEYARRFKENEFPVLACTKAFGMGIDKPNIRYTIHYGIPGSLEAFYQEAGRAGRDRKTAYNFIIFSDDHPELARRLLDPDLTLEDVRKVGQDRANEGDVGRMFFFHFNSFAGVEEELRHVDSLLKELGPILDRSTRVVSYQDENERSSMEKAIHRLHLLGIVEDYTLDYSLHQFELYLLPPTRESITDHLLGYTERYSMWRARGIRARLQTGPEDLNGFVRHAARVLVEFVYEAVERGRRIALGAMYQVAKEATTGEAVRERILEYLQESKFSKAVEELPTIGAFAADAFEAVMDLAAVPSDASEMRGATIRMLESQPDSPSLLILRGFLESLLRPEEDEVLQDFVVAGLRSLENRYAAGVEERRTAKAEIVRLARKFIPSGLHTVVQACVDQDPETARRLLCENDDEDVVRPAVGTLVAGLAKDLAALADTLTR